MHSSQYNNDLAVYAPFINLIMCTSCFVNKVQNTAVVGADS